LFEKQPTYKYGEVVVIGSFMEAISPAQSYLCVCLKSCIFDGEKFILELECFKDRNSDKPVNYGCKDVAFIIFLLDVAMTHYHENNVANVVGNIWTRNWSVTNVKPDTGPRSIDNVKVQIEQRDGRIIEYKKTFFTNKDMSPFAEINWRWCTKCSNIVWISGTGGCCYDGLPHSIYKPSSYLMYQWPDTEIKNGTLQDGWTWCSLCDALFYKGTGYCPKSRGAHSDKGSNFYVYQYPESGMSLGNRGQKDWYWCNKCGCLCYDDQSKKCSYDKKSHSKTNSANYVLWSYGSKDGLKEVPDFTPKL